ncbi:unnamed protein product [Camellia sinensis]
MECVEFQGLSKGERENEDLMAMELAKKKKWRRCPNCKFYVEKDDGCLHITCSVDFISAIDVDQNGQSHIMDAIDGRGVVSIFAIDVDQTGQGHIMDVNRNRRHFLRI